MLPKKPIKIVRLLSRLNVGGPAKHLILLISFENKFHFESVFYCGELSKGESGMDFLAGKYGVTVNKIGYLKRAVGFFDLFAFFKILKILFREKPDIIDTHASKAGFLGRIAGTLYKFLGHFSVKRVHTFHGHTFSGYFHWGKSGFFLWLERFLGWFSTDRIIVISEQQRGELAEKYLVGKPDIFRVVPLGLDWPSVAIRSQNFRRNYHIPSKALLIGFVGRFTAVKNPLIFIEMAEILLRRSPDSQLFFAMVGDGELRKLSEQRVRELNLTDKFVFTGFLENLEMVYVDLDILVVPSKNEGTPMAILEALFFKTAVVASAVGGIPELLCHNWKRKKGRWTLIPSTRHRGILVDRIDARAFSEKVEMLIHHPELRNLLGKRGHPFAKNFHSLPRLLKDMEQIYLEVLGEPY